MPNPNDDVVFNRYLVLFTDGTKIVEEAIDEDYIIDMYEQIGKKVMIVTEIE
ncbi:MAG: hypothetical protein KIC88_00700 [Acinetobacter sp.]|nr:hypothetical protein [Acinetobacter sp.]